MAIPTPTLLSSTGFATSSTSIVSDAFTPTAGALLVVAAAFRDASTVVAQLTSTSFVDSFLGTGAWTEIAAHTEDTVAVFSAAMAYAQLGPTPGSGAVTVNLANTTGIKRVLTAFEMTGHSQSAPIAESTYGQDATTGVTRAIADMLPGNLGVAVICKGSGTTVPFVGDTDFTELAQVSETLDTSLLRLQVIFDPNGDETQVVWNLAVAQQSKSFFVEFAQATAVTLPSSFAAGSNRGSRGRTRFGSR